MRAHRSIRRHIAHDFRAAIDHGDDVLEVVAGEDVIAAAAVKRLQLRGDEQRRRDDSHGMSGDINGLGRFDRGRIPLVAEAEHRGVGGHDVDDQVTMPPAAERCAWGGVFAEAQRTKTIRKCRVLSVGRHVDDRIDILGRAYGHRPPDR